MTPPLAMKIRALLPLAQTAEARAMIEEAARIEEARGQALESCPPVSLHTRAASSVCVAVQTKELQKALHLRHEPRLFTRLDLARSYAIRCVKTHYVMMGDCPLFLVVCPADAARLERAGYELMPC